MTYYCIMEESLDDVSPEHDWRAEAAAVMQDIRDLVKEINVSSLLRSDNKLIYLNLTTLEDVKYTIELSGLGFRVVSMSHDSLSSSQSSEQHYYDTPYALLSTVSQSYQQRLSKCLAEKLNALKDDGGDLYK